MSPGPCHQLLVIPLFHDLAAVEDEDPVHVPHRRQAVRHDDGGTTLQEVGDRILDQVFRDGVEARGGFVENQDRRIGEDGAGDRHALPLAAGEFDATLPDQRVVSCRKPADEIVRVRLLRR